MWQESVLVSCFWEMKIPHEVDCRLWNSAFKEFVVSNFLPTRHEKGWPFRFYGFLPMSVTSSPLQCEACQLVKHHGVSFVVLLFILIFGVDLKIKACWVFSFSWLSPFCSCSKMAEYVVCIWTVVLLLFLLLCILWALELLWNTTYKPPMSSALSALAFCPSWFPL